MNECNAAKDSPQYSTERSPGSSIVLKGTSHGFEIFIEPEATVDTVASDIADKLREAPGFFKGGDVTLRFEGPPPRGYLSSIESVTSQYDLRIVGVHGLSKKKESAQQPSTNSLTRELGLVEATLATGSHPTSLPADLAKPQNPKLGKSSAGAALAPKMIVGPVRSGCVLEVSGHLIVLGDVNPGAEIRAQGSIVVLGRLRGIAHAGCCGGSSFILALQLEPQQLRIGSLVARSEDAELSPDKAEIAYAKDGGILVDHYKGRLPFGIETAKF